MKLLSLASLSGFSLVALLASCVCIDGSCSSRAKVVGSGVEALETRPLAEFRAIEIKGGIDVVARVGGTQSVEVSGDDNVLPFLKTEVRGGSLVVEMEEGSYRFKQRPRVTVGVAALDAVSIAGSGDCDVEGLRGAAFGVSIAGSGNVRAKGEVERVEVSIAGSGDVGIEGLQARSAQVRIAGSGDVHLHATESLAISIQGSGDVRYRGRPQVTQKVQGSGDIVAE